MKFKPQNNGLLSPDNVKEGDKITIIEEAYSVMNSKGQEYWNVKVELADGTHKLASIFGKTSELFYEHWGDETTDWIGKVARVEIYTSQAGKTYIVLNPITTTHRGPEDTGDEMAMAIELPPDPDNRIKPEDIGF